MTTPPRPTRTNMQLRNDSDRFCRRILAENPVLDYTRKLYAIQLKEDENTEGYNTVVARSRCKKFIEDAFKRNRKDLDFSMTDKGFYEFSCYLSYYQFRTLKGKSEVESIEPIPRPRLVCDD